jgi:hypothetical protein
LDTPALPFGKKKTFDRDRDPDPDPAEDVYWQARAIASHCFSTLAQSNVVRFPPTQSLIRLPSHTFAVTSASSGEHSAPAGTQRAGLPGPPP